MTTRSNLSSLGVSTGLLVMAVVATTVFAWLWVLNLGTPAQLDFGTRFTPIVLTASGLVFVVVGWMITSRRPGNKVGWVALFIGMSAIVSTVAIEYTILATVTDPGSLPGGEIAAWVANSVWVVPVGLLGTVLVLLYPDGKLPNRRWRIVLMLALAGMGATIFYLTLAPGPLENFDWIDNPFGLEGSEGWIEWFSLGLFLLAATVPLAVWSMRRQYRRSSGAVRAQIRWFAAAAGLVAATYVGQLIFSALTGTLDGGSPAHRWFQTLSIAGFGVMAIAIGVAVLRYRLYDLDRIITRTVSYGLVVALLGLVVLALVSVLAVFLPSDDPLVVAVSTLVVFALFTPVSRWTQKRVDRRFNRSRYDAQLVISRFTASLQDRVDPDEVMDGWVDVVEDTLQPAAVGVWVRR